MKQQYEADIERFEQQQKNASLDLSKKWEECDAKYAEVTAKLDAATQKGEKLNDFEFELIGRQNAIAKAEETLKLKALEDEEK